MRADYHVHTYYSDDSDCPMEDMIQRALQIGLDEIAFTDHVDYGIKTDTNCKYASYFEEIQRMRQKYRGQIAIKCGMEFGVQIQTVPLYERDVAMYDFDFIILSNHQVDNKEFWNYVFQEGKTQDEYQRAYYQAILDVIKAYKHYSVLGHLDMIKRYDRCGDYPDEKVMDLIDRILLQVIEDGKGIEVNTSSFKYGLKDLMPSRAILKRYGQLGGRLITMGSDTHETAHLADHMEEVRAELNALGFDSFCTFTGGVAEYHLL